MAIKNNLELSKREQVIRAMLDEKKNGVRFGTSLLLAICETTEDSPEFADRLDTLHRTIKGEILTPKDPYPEYKPMVD